MPISIDNCIVENIIVLHIHSFYIEHDSIGSEHGLKILNVENICQNYQNVLKILISLFWSF